MANIASECLYCRYTYGLQVQLIESIEDMFYAFLRETGQQLNSFKHEQWIRYFKNHAHYRTVCHECNVLIEDRYYKRKERDRVREAIGDDERADMINMDRNSRNKRIQQIEGVSD
jgi:hypothetical protein